MKPDIVETIMNEGIGLKKIGKSWKARCPFHEEKTASFVVNEDKQFFNCFGCGAKGDVYKFLMLYKGLSFKEVFKLSGNEFRPDPQYAKKRIEMARKAIFMNMYVVWLAGELFQIESDIDWTSEVQSWQILARLYHKRTSFELDYEIMMYGNKEEKEEIYKRVTDWLPQ